MEVSERLNDDLARKNESFILLDEQCKSMAGERERAKQLKEDLAQIVKDKVRLEEDFHKAKEAAANLEVELTKAKEERDEALAKLQNLEAEKALHTKEMQESTKKVDELYNMLSALGKSKEMVIDELKEHIVQRDKVGLLFFS